MGFRGVCEQKGKRQSDTHRVRTYPTQHRKTESVKEKVTDPKTEILLINSSTQKLKTQRKCTEMLTVVSLGCEITGVFLPLYRFFGIFQIS